MKNVQEQLKEAGYDCAVAVATEAEIAAQAACGQLGLIVEQEKNGGGSK